jgi:membrane protein DedA with SNARE-associated domain
LWPEKNSPKLEAGKLPIDPRFAHIAYLSQYCIASTSGFVYLETFRYFPDPKGLMNLVSVMARHGYAWTFWLLLVEAMGVPFPASIALVAAGAAVAAHALWGPYVLVAAIAALMLGDSVQFWLGRFMGWALLGFLCRVSINPETCILRSAQSFYKRGKVTLVIAKFIPGVNTMAAPLAGSMKMRFWQFLRLEFAGASIYVLTYLAIGYVSRDFLAAVLNGFHAAGRAMEIVVITALAVYAIYRIMQYRKNRMYAIVPRVQVEELARRLASQDADRVQIIDVRSHGYYDAGAARIKNSIRIEPNNLENEIKNLPKDKDIYLYCT